LFHQGIAEHNLKPAEKQAFFVTLRRLAGCHGRLPESMIITDKVEVPDKILSSGGFADVRSGTYMGHLVAVKTVRVAPTDDLLKIRKVSVGDINQSRHEPNHSVPAILQRGRYLEHVIPSERLETCWGSGGHGERTICHCVRVDGAWEHRGVHKNKPRQQTGTGT
jgi:hypothetical protein